ncbi:MAG: hypothetical protein QOC58_478 [Mycobacterium sp.]|jgi:ABC-type nickel/cobalt efflux system permease component RcnA|nr:hypothetical protein [Mycobacterium sp.]
MGAVATTTGADLAIVVGLAIAVGLAIMVMVGLATMAVIADQLAFYGDRWDR